MSTQTEEEKLREQIPLSDQELVDWLNRRGVRFDRDGAGVPWLGYSTLVYVIQMLEGKQ